MEKEGIIKSLHPLEIKVLLNFSGKDRLTADVLAEKLGYKVGQANQAFSWLSGKGFAEEIERVEKAFYELTEFGEQCRTGGTPRERMIRLLQEKGPLDMGNLGQELGLEKKDVGSAFGALSKAGILAMNPEKKVEVADPAGAEESTLDRLLLDKAGEAGGTLDAGDLDEKETAAMGKISKKRGAAGSLFKYVEREEVIYAITPQGEKVKQMLVDQGVTGEEIGAVTAEMLADGSWKGKSFRSYNIHIPASRVLLGRRNPYGEYLQWVKDKLVSLGFEEFDGPLVETEFWNGDALFMPQFHSARDIHDVYYVKNPSQAKEIEQPWLDQVAAAHEDGGKTASRGWGYTFDRGFTRRQVMRSQGTVLSAKQLPKAKVPGKYFGLARCFRYDQVDATHGADFYQTEGIMIGEDVNLRTLLGLLKMFAEEVAGAEEVRYVPGYFPFTEPSIEVHIKHPELGWFELGGSGIFRPEVTEPLGIDVPVLAWGLGIDRMALMHLGLNDLRELFTPDIESVRMRRKM